jgi:hypothetical protein
MLFRASTFDWVGTSRTKSLLALVSTLRDNLGLIGDGCRIDNPRWVEGMQMSNDGEWKPDSERGLAMKKHYESALYDRIRRLGFSSVTEFIEAFPGETYHQLARWRVRPNIMPIFLMEAHAREAVQQGTVRRYAMEVLVRQMRDALPAGWHHSKDKDLDGKTVSAVATLDVRSQSAGASRSDLQAIDRTWKALLALNPPIGWQPKDSNDPVIQKAFEIGWPEEAAQ